MLINASFKPLSEFFKDPISLASSVNFDNYTKAWELANFPSYMFNSAFYTAVATAVFVFTSVFVAFPIARGIIKGGGALLTFYVVALFLPPALIPQFQLILNLGLYNTRTGLHPALPRQCDRDDHPGQLHQVDSQGVGRIGGG